MGSWQKDTPNLATVNWNQQHKIERNGVITTRSQEPANSCRELKKKKKLYRPIFRMSSWVCIMASVENRWWLKDVADTAVKRDESSLHIRRITACRDGAVHRQRPATAGWPQQPCSRQRPASSMLRRLMLYMPAVAATAAAAVCRHAATAAELSWCGPISTVNTTVSSTLVVVENAQTLDRWFTARLGRRSRADVDWQTRILGRRGLRFRTPYDCAVVTRTSAGLRKDDAPRHVIFRAMHVHDRRVTHNNRFVPSRLRLTGTSINLPCLQPMQAHSRPAHLSQRYLVNWIRSFRCNFSY